MAQDSIIDVIGGTPSIWLDRMVQNRGLNGRILAKLDYLNPGFSKKDRAAKGVIEMAETSGALKPGQTVVELTSGNMGTGLAIVCSIKGYPFVAVMSRGNSVERARMMVALGAEVILVDQLPESIPGQVSGGDLAEVDKMAKIIVKERDGFRADQFHHTGNRESHYTTTGPELWHDSNQTITAFVDFVGSGGTYSGTVKSLKEFNPEIKGYVLEPLNAAALSGCTVRSAEHPIQGGGYAMDSLDFMTGVPVDGYLTVSGDEARNTARNLAKEEGIFAGFSAGANVAAALKLLDGELDGGTIGVVICDSGLKYLSTDLWY